MGVFLLQMPVERKEVNEETCREFCEQNQMSRPNERLPETMKPVMTRKDFIWMHDTRERHEQLRPFSVF